MIKNIQFICYFGEECILKKVVKFNNDINEQQIIIKGEEICLQRVKEYLKIPYRDIKIIYNNFVTWSFKEIF